MRNETSPTFRRRAGGWRCRIGLALALVLSQAPATATEAGGRIERTHRGVHLVALPAKPGRTFDTSVLPGAAGLDSIAKALDHLLNNSPRSARALATLKRNGKVLLAYVPDDLRSPTGGGEAVALYVPEHLRDRDPRGREKTFYVLVGRHGVKWPTQELAAVLAHELLGHGLQDHRGQFRTTRNLDLECEAYLHEEIVNQDLKLDKFSREMIEFRQSLEQHWCMEFKLYMRAHRPGDMVLWDELNPDVPKLLKAFEAYTAYLTREGIAGKALAAERHQFRQKVDQALRDASPDELFKAALVLRDGGVGVKPDLSASFRYFRAAADLGHTEAMVNTARMHEKGMGAARDAEAALSWYRRAAEKGNARAQTYYGWLHLKGRGVTRDYDMAHRWFAEAMDQGEPQATYYLATMHRLGLGCDEDHAAAARLYRRAAEAGHAEAQYRLGWYLYRGTGVAKDPDAAAEWFGIAARQGHTDAQVRLAWLHVKGIGVPRDYVAAYAWYSVAAAEGHDRAGDSRDLLATQMDPDDLAAAKRRAAELAANG